LRSTAILSYSKNLKTISRYGPGNSVLAFVVIIAILFTNFCYLIRDIMPSGIVRSHRNHKYIFGDKVISGKSTIIY